MSDAPTNAPKVSVIVRTRNEESWVGHCLSMLFKQDYPDLEVIVVDNESSDHTVQVVGRYPVKEVVSISEYRPGRALNMGIGKSSGDYIACLSAHCIPQNEGWIKALMAGFADAGIAGVYGRQLPLAYSPALDKRDLITVFGLDRRVQIKDYYFHNANSMIRRDVWTRYPFDEGLTNIEDRHWGKTVIDAGYRLAYEPDAAVFHHHGINQSNDRERAGGVSNTMDVVDAEMVSALPDSLKPENCNVVAVAPVLGEPRELQGYDLFSNLLRQLTEARYLRSIYAFSESAKVRDLAEKAGAIFVPRPDELCSPERTLGEVLKYVLGKIEERGDYPQSILYVNYLCPFRPASLFDELLTEQQYKGLDSVFPAYVDYNDHWVSLEANTYERVSRSQRPDPDKPWLYRSIYGLGCAVHASVIRRGELIGDTVGIVPIHDHIYTLRCADSKPEPSALSSTESSSPLGWTSELFLREFRP